MAKHQGRVGARIREARHRKQWTLSDLAARVGVGIAFLSEVERGGRPAPRERREDIASALGLSVADVTELDGETLAVVAERLASNGWTGAARFVREMGRGGA